MKKISQLAVAAISLSIATGILVHDGGIDKAHGQYSGQLNLAADGKVVSFGQPHTHPTSSGGATSPFAGDAPARPPKELEDIKRALLQNHEPRGRHAFDNSHLPIVG